MHLYSFKLNTYIQIAEGEDFFFRQVYPVHVWPMHISAIGRGLVIQGWERVTSYAQSASSKWHVDG